MSFSAKFAVSGCVGVDAFFLPVEARRSKACCAFDLRAVMGEEEQDEQRFFRCDGFLPAVSIDCCDYLWDDVASTGAAGRLGLELVGRADRQTDAEHMEPCREECCRCEGGTGGE